MGLWIVLAIAVFSVTFDWQTRVAGHAFVQAQVLRQRQGQPIVTINDGFTPMVRAAARRLGGMAGRDRAAGAAPPPPSWPPAAMARSVKCSNP